LPTVRHRHISLSVAFQSVPTDPSHYDRRLKTIYIQAGVSDEIALIIDQEGRSLFMTQDLSQMIEIKKSISSEHRNDAEQH